MSSWFASDATHASTSPSSSTCSLASALAHRARELADLLGQPRDRDRHTSFAIALEVGLADDVLELAQLHGSTMPEPARITPPSPAARSS